MSNIFFDPYYESVNIIAESDVATIREGKAIKVVLEDTNSPVTTKYIEKLYDSVISKSHVDFDDIPNTKGSISSYKGYNEMNQILDILMKLAIEQKSVIVKEYVDTVQKSIRYIVMLENEYSNGFRLKNDYVMLEYNTFVYTIIQAVSTLLYEFVDYIKRPDKKVIDISLKNTKYKANAYYIDQLHKFNMVNEKMNYQKYLRTLIQNGNNNFTGAEVLGLSAVLVVALAAIPITRELVYGVYKARASVSDCLAQHAYFLEMNKASVEANTNFDVRKRDGILLKQEKIKVMLLRVSEKLRVEHIKSVDNVKKTLQSDNKLLTIDNIRKEVDNSPLQLM